MTLRPRHATLIVLRTLAVAACAADTATPAPVMPSAAAAYASWPDPLESLPDGDDQTQRVCERSAQDRVHDVFCGETEPTFTALAELQGALGVGSESISGFAQASLGQVTAIAIASHSTALGARAVSALNPRVISTQIDLVEKQLMAVAFTRGEQLVEIVARDRADNSMRFYVVGFRQPCNTAADGCGPGDVLTPAVERDWTQTRLYDETDLQNTVFDCAPCHQPNGPDTPKMLRMQELDSPWTHWFSRNSVGGRALYVDYKAAKGDEPLAAMSAEQIETAEPEALATFVTLLNPSQPNKFDSGRIEREVQLSAAALGGNQPDDNTIAGQSATWQSVYEQAQLGEAIAVPYHDVKVSDPTKLARLTTAYQAFREGELERAQLPDLRNIYPDDPTRLAELGFTTAPSLDGRGTLLSACSTCHNARLDQSLSRARFRADLEGISRGEREAAIARLMLPSDNPRAMPPARMRFLSADARARAIATLKE